MRRKFEFKKEVGELSGILEKIKSRKLTIKHFFDKQSVKNESVVLPAIKFIGKNKSKSSPNLYSKMEIHLANVMPKEKKTTVQQLMKMTNNAKALVSSENVEYHTDKVLNYIKLKPLNSYMN